MMSSTSPTSSKIIRVARKQLCSLQERMPQKSLTCCMTEKLSRSMASIKEQLFPKGSWQSESSGNKSEPLHQIRCKEFHTGQFGFGVHDLSAAHCTKDGKPSFQRGRLC